MRVLWIKSTVVDCLPNGSLSYVSIYISKIKKRKNEKEKKLKYSLESTKIDYLEGKEVIRVNSFNFLGVTLDECLSFICYLRLKIASGLGLLSLLRRSLTTVTANQIHFLWYYSVYVIVIRAFIHSVATTQRSLVDYNEELQGSYLVFNLMYLLKQFSITYAECLLQKQWKCIVCNWFIGVLVGETPEPRYWSAY